MGMMGQKQALEMWGYAMLGHSAQAWHAQMLIKAALRHSPGV